MTHGLRPAVFVAALGAALLFAPRAQGESIIKDPNPPKYSLEIEPKLNIAAFFWKSYGGEGYGPGVRLSIPVMSPGFVKSINDSVAISFGLDLVRYSGGYYGYWGWNGWCNADPRRCPGWYANYAVPFWAVHVPVVLQWNFWLTDKWSVFGEPGLTLRHAFYDTPSWCGPAYPGTCTPSSNDFYFTFFAGGRFHFSEKIALTMRLGHPIDFSIGLSIFN